VSAAASTTLEKSSFIPTQNDQFSGKSPKKEKEKKKPTLMVPLLNTCVGIKEDHIPIRRFH
jgi:hypothetical protein